MIKTLAVYATLGAAALAAPTKRQAAAVTDADILNYALTLEHLEDTFYRQALANYTADQFAADGFDATFYSNIQEVSKDETTHVQFLTSALEAAGAPATAECTYNFPATDPKSFLALAQVLEGVGVSAYLGAAGDIMNKTYLGAAGSILTVESRHSAYIRNGNGVSPFPAAFDIPLDFDEVYTLAAQFIAACPSTNPPLPVKAFPTLTLDPSQPAPVKAGDTVTFDVADGCDLTGTPSGAWIGPTGPTFVPVTVNGNSITTTVPAEGIVGQSYFVLNSDSTAVSDDKVLAGPAVLEVAPA